MGKVCSTIAWPACAIQRDSPLEAGRASSPEAPPGVAARLVQELKHEQRSWNKKKSVCTSADRCDCFAVVDSRGCSTAE